ncbi:MAG: GntR family transcriptional regulator [Spirochaetes bacterium]|nr:GntR family transcriptional regulator [Spirochaetota bacterium]
MNEKNAVPYYLQLKNILKARIQAGEIKTKKLPSVRQVAKEYGVSVNTVLRAYNELGNEGIVTGSVGKGTFVNITPQQLSSYNRRVLLKKIVEHALEEALSGEYTIEEFEKAVFEYVSEKREMMQKVGISFVECNIEQLTYFTDHLDLDPHIRRIPVLLDDLRRHTHDAFTRIQSSDIVVTSFYHLAEVQSFFDGDEKPIIGINIEPEVSTLITIAKIPITSTVGIVTSSAQFLIEIKEVLDRLKLRFEKLLETHTSNERELAGIIDRCDAVLVSPKQKRIVEELAGENTKVIEFVFIPDRTSINNLKLAIIELKKSLIGTPDAGEGAAHI